MKTSQILSILTVTLSIGSVSARKGSHDRFGRNGNSHVNSHGGSSGNSGNGGSTPSGLLIHPDGKCGGKYGCASGECCSQYGYWSVTLDSIPLDSVDKNFSVAQAMRTVERVVTPTLVVAKAPLLRHHRRRLHRPLAHLVLL
jgi:hypothetical protein